MKVYPTNKIMENLKSRTSKICNYAERVLNMQCEKNKLLVRYKCTLWESN